MIQTLNISHIVIANDIIFSTEKAVTILIFSLNNKFALFISEQYIRILFFSVFSCNYLWWVMMIYKTYFATWLMCWLHSWLADQYITQLLWHELLHVWRGYKTTFQDKCNHKLLSNLLCAPGLLSIPTLSLVRYMTEVCSQSQVVIGFGSIKLLSLLFTIVLYSIACSLI